MAKGTKEEIDAARAELGRSIQAFVELASEYSDEKDEHPFVGGWVVAYEYTSVSLEAEDSTIDDIIVPDNQLRGTSRGIFMCGLDHFTRVRVVNDIS